MNAVDFSYSTTCAVSRLGVAEVSKARIEQATQAATIPDYFVGDLFTGRSAVGLREKEASCM